MNGIPYPGWCITEAWSELDRAGLSKRFDVHIGPDMGSRPDLRGFPIVLALRDSPGILRGTHPPDVLSTARKMLEESQ